MKIRTKEQLIDYINDGNKVKYLFFWGHQEKSNETTKSCLSQWYESPFEIGGITYKTAEHYMMAEKARLFGDKENEVKAIEARDPGKAKSVGRSVTGFDHHKWLDHRMEIVIQGNLAKFSQNPALRKFLLNSNDRVLVEASPVDKVWGIGLAHDHPESENPRVWSGLNLLGFALMEVRYLLVR